MKKYDIAIIGVSGAVGEEILKILDEQRFPINNILPLASKNSVGKKISFQNKEYDILETTHDVFSKHSIDIAFFSAGGSVSKEYVRSAVNAGALVIDNTSYFRMDNDVPLVVPEVNPLDIFSHNGIIANPNCSTIQMVQVLSPLHRAFEIIRVDVSTYQAVSGAGKKGMETLKQESSRLLNGDNIKAGGSVFPYTIGFNLIPQIDIFLENDYTKEEIKMIKETNKIMHSSFEVSATCVRVPVMRSHSESITIRFNSKVSKKSVFDVLKNTENIVVIDDPKNLKYPMPSIASNTDSTYVGRIREDYFDKNIIHLWCVADQIRVGAATNAVRIAQKWINSK